MRFKFRGKKHFQKKYIFSYAVLALLLLLLATQIKYTFTGRWEGFFVLKGRQGKFFEVKDDIYLGDGVRLVFALDLGSLHSCRPKDNPDRECLYSEWDERDGCGFVRSFFPGNRELLICLGRALDDSGEPMRGLFLGGGLPASVQEDDMAKLNETGMAWSDGKKWEHIWCTANEGLASGITMKLAPPSSWRFLGSKVLNRSDRSVAIRSSHEAVVDGVPLRVERHAYFRAGDRYFVLSTRVKNTGRRPASVYYCYGDEPWLGRFGSSRGNVGWVKDRIIEYEEFVDTGRYMSAGFFNNGSDAIGEGHDFSRAANFIRWYKKDKPIVFFSNGPPVPGRREPLQGDARSIGIQWGPDVILPGAQEHYMLAVGMAEYDPALGLPVRPKTNLKYIK